MLMCVQGKFPVHCFVSTVEHGRSHYYPNDVLHDAWIYTNRQPFFVVGMTIFQAPAP